jgi:hypothetical protein
MSTFFRAVRNAFTRAIPSSFQRGSTLAKLADSSYHRGAAADVEGYQLVRQDKDRAVYEREKEDGSKEAVISFSGTRLKGSQRKHDLLADAALVLGLHGMTNRFKDSLKQTRALVDQYGADNVRAVGHSLGGSQAAYVAKKTGVQAAAFNPGATLANLKDFNKDTTVYKSTKDPISFLSSFSRANVETVSKGGHSLKNFL